jgi:hypothetical protein
MTNVQFGWEASGMNGVGETDDSGISVEDWAEMSDDEKQAALDDWVFGGSRISIWSDPE